MHTRALREWAKIENNVECRRKSNLHIILHPALINSYLSPRVRAQQQKNQYKFKKFFC